MAPDISRVRIRFKSLHPDIALPDKTGSILINTDFHRSGLSQVVNKLLGREKQIPFIFLINGVLLQTSLHEYLTQKGISFESTIELEYSKATMKPVHVGSFVHDDWVSSVDVLSNTGRERILSGSYDGLLRVWSMSSQITAASPGASDGGHTASIKAARFISPTQIASSGFDRTIRIWNYSENDDLSPAALIPQIELYGHKAMVLALAVHQPSSRILSASADQSVGLWSTNEADAPAAPESCLSLRDIKRRETSSNPTPQRGPLALLKSHTEPVSSVLFAPHDSTVAYSASWDHGLKTWDLTTATAVDTRVISHSIFSLVALPSLNLVAAGTSGRDVTLIDPRASATNIVAMTLKGHTNDVVSLATDPDNTNCLASGSHDGFCRIWDIRSVKAEKKGSKGQCMHTIGRQSNGGKAREAGHGIKVFGVVWDSNVGLVSAGEDKVVQINRTKESEA
ncbi:MAG: hypothetical protein Q9218_000083 [Villophora microphyllina]